MRRILLPLALTLILLNINALSQTCPEVLIGGSSGGEVKHSFFESNDTVVVSGKKILCTGAISTVVNGSCDYTERFFGTINSKMKLKISELKSGDKVHLEMKHFVREKKVKFTCISKLIFIIK